MTSIQTPRPPDFENLHAVLRREVPSSPTLLEFIGAQQVMLGEEPVAATYGERIAILGGLDMDFLCRETPEAIAERCRGLLDMSREKGGYALGTGNSIAPYIPCDSFRAIVDTALEG